MNNKYGSVWNKWDFHVHTPYSILNNNYGFNPYDEKNRGRFDEYVKTLFTKAIEENIAAIGITDYFMIEGYKRITQEYLNNPTKMEELFPEASMRDQIQRIYVFPNVELRLNTFVGNRSHSVNYHVIFSNDLSAQEIEENFLHQLEFEFEAGNKLSLTRANIERHGRTVKINNGKTGSDLLVGLEHVTVNHDVILDTLTKAASLFGGKYLITISVDEDLSCVRWDGRDYPTRRNLYQQCDCYLTSNKKTAVWALAEGEEEARKAEFGSIKPCIWGSDAHEYDRMFHPENDQFCWIKAEPTFEGLLQILYEPKERVAIQKDCPNQKDAHQIIESIQFDDDNFQTDPIVFNDNLTCIIGGKSTGKSLLIQQLAKTIDPLHVRDQEFASTLKSRTFSVKQAVVKWKDGTSDGRKIVYIPQTYLNRTTDNPEESTAINKIIADVLQQEPEISTAFSVLNEKRKSIKKNVKENISKYCEKKEELREIRESIRQLGSPESFESMLSQLESERSELAAKVDIQEFEIQEYKTLKALLENLKNQLIKYKDEICNFESLQKPIVIIPGLIKFDENSNILHDFQQKFPAMHEKLEECVKELEEIIRPKWEENYRLFVASLNELVEKTSKEIEQTQTPYEALRVKVEQNEQLQKLSAHIFAEQEKLNEAKDYSEKEKQILAEMKILQEKILESQNQFLVAYNEYCKMVVSVGTKKDTELSFDAQPVWKQKDFLNCLSGTFDNRNFSTFRTEYHYDLNALSEKDYGENFLIAIWEAFNVKKVLTLKSGYTIESALQQIFEDWYNIHYIVTSGNDTIDEMSPGKKALVLLELLISLEDSKCPILIDQPEDDLDNRSIYNDLVQYIRKKKKERQIIVVTHNANIVLGADAEEVIIANQDANNTPNVSKRFEYRSGAIENDDLGKDDSGKPLSGILNQQGIQTQICEILEGGHPAFELRRNKYTKMSLKV